MSRAVLVHIAHLWQSFRAPRDERPEGWLTARMWETQHWLACVEGDWRRARALRLRHGSRERGSQ